MTAVAHDRLIDNSLFAATMVAVASVMFGFVPFFAKNLVEMGMGAPAVAFWRFMLGAVFLWPFLVLRGPGREATLWGLLTGAMIACGWIGYVHALTVLSVSTTSVLYMTYPFFTVLIGWVFFRDPPGLRTILATLLIVIGAILAAGFAGIGTPSLFGLLAAIVAPATFGFAINILARKMSLIPPMSRVPCASIGAVLGLLPIVFLTLPLEQVAPTSPKVFVYLILLATFGALIPQLLYVMFAPKVGASMSAMAGSVELPTMIMVGWLAFGENLTVLQVLGAAIVTCAVLITPSQRAGKVSQQIARE